MRFAGQLIVFTGLRGRRRQLVALELEQGALAPSSGCRVEQRLPLAPQRLVSLSRLAIGSHLRIEPAVSIEQLALAVRVEQGSPFELPVDVDQQLRELLERRDGDRQPVDLALPRPCDESRRVMMSWSSSSEPPRTVSTSPRRSRSAISKTAAARASVLPDRIKSADALPPNTSPSAVRSKLLPAPVSPVQAQYPASSST